MAVRYVIVRVFVCVASSLFIILCIWVGFYTCLIVPLQIGPHPMFEEIGCFFSHVSDVLGIFCVMGNVIFSILYVIYWTLKNCIYFIEWTIWCICDRHVSWKTNLFAKSVDPRHHTRETRIYQIIQVCSHHIYLQLVFLIV